LRGVIAARAFEGRDRNSHWPFLAQEADSVIPWIELKQRIVPIGLTVGRAADARHVADLRAAISTKPKDLIRI
jgi:hypothetical protein